MEVVAPLEPLIDRTGRYRATDAVLRRYRLPEGITVDTEASMTAIAKILDVPPRKLSTAWGIAERFTHHTARPDQPPATKNIQVWEVLALMEMGLLDKPE